MAWTQADLGARLQALVSFACRMDVEAYKPGNVSVYAAGHGMTAADFVASAEAIAPVITLPGLSVGQRVRRSIEATWGAVGCNTNLGIVLLCAPLVQAAYQASAHGERLRPALLRVLHGLDVADTEDVFAAIRLAKPAGLGQRGQHDVSGHAEAGLLEVMRSAAQHDRIAYQYTSGYEDVFELGVRVIEVYSARWQAVDPVAGRWPMVACYLTFLSTIPDTHIERKFGGKVAEQVMKMAERLESKLKACENPADEMQAVQAFDEKLKREGLNPGTSADLAVASLLSFHIDGLFADVHTSRSVSSPEAA